MAAETRVGSSRRDPAASLAESYPLSLIVPVRNGGRFLEYCLEAIRANDLRSAEVIVVDDGSTDDSAAIVARLSEDWPQLRLMRLERPRGPAGARNAGARAARMPGLLFVDADIMLPPGAVGWIRESLQLYSHRREVIGVLGVYSPDIPDDGFWSRYKNLYTCYLYATTDTITPFVHTPVLYLDGEALQRLGGFDAGIRRGEDFHLGLRLAEAGLKVVIERRLEAVHLKGYTLRSLLVEDWRRVSELRRLPMTARQRRLARGAHRWRRLAALALPLPTTLLAAVSWLWPPALAGAGLLVVLFCLLQWPLLRYLRRRQGWNFAVRAVVFSWLEMGWAQLALLASAVRSAVTRDGRSAPPGGD